MNRILSEKEKCLDLYEVIFCFACESREELERHKYEDSIICKHCKLDLRNKELIEAAKEDEVKGYEGYYTEMSYNELMEERNS